MKRIFPVIAVTLCLQTSEALCDPYGGPVPGTQPPSQAVPVGPVGPPQIGNPENLGNPDNQGDQQGSPPGNPEPPGPAAPYNPLQNEPNGPGSPLPNSGQPGQSGQNGQGVQGGTPQSDAPTFMNGTLPNTQNPFLPTGISPGTFNAPLANLYELQGVPALAAPLMGQVYRPFGLTLYQPNPFQVVPQGTVSLTGSFETDTNINYSPTQPQVGSFYTIGPAVTYSNFDNYGYLSALAAASYVQYDTGNIPAYMEETGGVNAGSYLGNRVFVGIQDFVSRGDMPESNGSPLQFFNGVDPYIMNSAGAEVGIALTPKISFVETAMDFYYDASSFGAGISNIQSLSEGLNYIDKTWNLSADYTYSQGTFSIFPGFISNGVSGMAMRMLNPSTSIGVGGDYTYSETEGEPLLNFSMISGYGLFNHTFNRNVTASFMGGYNVVQFANGESFPGPMVDANVSYVSGPFSASMNVGWFQENQMSFGVEMGPEDVKQAMAYINYQISPRVGFNSSVGYAIYSFYSAPAFSNSFFQTLQSSQAYNSNVLDQSDGLFWTPKSWLRTGLEYNFIDFTTNIPNETVIDNQFVALVSIFFNF